MDIIISIYIYIYIYIYIHTCTHTYKTEVVRMLRPEHVGQDPRRRGRRFGLGSLKR